jgi:hypothetical protein
MNIPMDTGIDDRQLWRVRIMRALRELHADDPMRGSERGRRELPGAQVSRPDGGGSDAAKPAPSP